MSHSMFTTKTPDRESAEFMKWQLNDIVSRKLKSYMKRQKIGINEMSRRLETSFTQLQAILDNRANLQLSSIVKLARVMNCTVNIRFK